MSGLCGWIGDPAGTPAAVTLAAMAGGLVADACRDNVRHIGNDHALAASVGASLVTDEGISAVIEGRPRWQDDMLAEIAARQGNAAALVAGYRRDGRACLEHLGGDWAAILIDPAAHYGLFGIDRIGIHPLCYAAGNGRIVFGTTADCVRVFPGVAAHIDYQAVYDLLYFTRVSAPDTIYTGIAKLEPGQAVEFRDGVATVWRHARLNYAKPARVDEAALAEELRHVVRRAVARCLEGCAPGEVGAYLSGGVDSSTVTGMLAALSPVRARAFTVGFDADGYNEMAFAEAAARHFGIEHFHTYVTPDDILDFLPQMAAIYDEPFANGSAVPAYYCARQAAQNGVRVLLAGDGGDELFAGNERYVQQRRYERYHDLPAWLRRGVIEPIVGLLPDDEASLIAKPKRYVRRSNIPLPERLESFNHFARISADEVFVADIAQRIDTHRPVATMHRHYHELESASMVDRMMYLDLKITIADDDLRKVNRTAEASGVEVRYPLLDDEVVDFSCRLPDALQLKGGELRWFFKHAMRDFLPQSTLTKSKHGFGLPFDLWIRSNDRLRDYAYGKLNALACRGFFRQDFIERTIAAHRRGDLHSYGQLVWAMLLLELWLEGRHDRAADAAARIAASG